MKQRSVGKKAAGILVLTLGILFIAVGIFRGEMNTVFVKAVNLCLECIGIG